LLVKYIYFHLFYLNLCCAYCLTFSFSSPADHNLFVYLIIKNHAPLPYTELGAAGFIVELSKYRVARLIAPGAHYIKYYYRINVLETLIVASCLIYSGTYCAVFVMYRLAHVYA